MTEEQVLAIIDNVADRLALKFKFGYYTIDDMKQEARMSAWMALDKYDNVRPLENFLWTAAHNGLYNLKRDKFERPDLPCQKCPLSAYDPKRKNSVNGCTAFHNPEDCGLYNSWIKRNRDKRNILSPIDIIDGLKDENLHQEKNMKVWDNIDEKMDSERIFELIDEKLPVFLRPDWVKMKHDIFVPKPRRDKIMEEINRILTDAGIK